jgi:hypothetical protein
MSETKPDARKQTRVQVALSCTFGLSDDTPRSGTVTSLSLRGCFVKTRAWAERGMEMHVKIWLPEQRWLLLRGAVLYHMEKIGFGLSFRDLTPGESNTLDALINGGGASAEPA